MISNFYDLFPAARHRIKELEKLESNESRLFSDMAALVAFFQNLSSSMSISLIKSRKKFSQYHKNTEVLLWLESSSEFSQTKILFEIVNQFLVFLNSWASENPSFEVIKSLQNIHMSFDGLLSLYYPSLLNRIDFTKVTSTKMVENKKNSSENFDLTKFHQNFFSYFPKKQIPFFNPLNFLPSYDTIHYLEKKLLISKKQNNNNQNNDNDNNNGNDNNNNNGNDNNNNNDNNNDNDNDNNKNENDDNKQNNKNNDNNDKKSTKSNKNNKNTTITNLRNLYKDVIRTSRELFNLQADEKNCELLGKDFILNPRLDIVRENPQFQIYSSRMASYMPSVLTEYKDLDSKIRDMFLRINELNRKLEKSFALPQINFDELYSLTVKEREVSIELLKMKFLNGIFVQLKDICPPSQNLCITLIQKIHQKYDKINQQTEYDAKMFDNFLKELGNMLGNEPEIEKQLNDQASEQISLRRKLEESLRQLSTSKRAPAISQTTKDRLDELQKETADLEKSYISQRSSMNDILLQSIERHLALFSEISVKPLFPFEIERMMSTISEQAAQYQWMNGRLELQKKENVKLLKEKQNLKEKLAGIRSEIEAKKKIRGSLKMRNAGSNSSRKREQCLCPICRKRDRNAYINKCGHIFCEECLKGFVTCPECAIDITTDDILKVNWS